MNAWPALLALSLAADTSAKPPAAPAAGAPSSLANVRVTGVDKIDADGRVVTPPGGGPTEAALGDVIVVHATDLRSLSQRARCLDAADRPVAAGCQKHEIALYLDGREIRDVLPESGAPRPDSGTLRFHLVRSPKSDEAWADLLGAAPLGDQFRPTSVSVGLADDYALDTAVDGSRFRLIRMRPGRLALALLALVGLVAGVWYLGDAKGMLRDRGPVQPLRGPTAASDRRPFSLARVQMAFWFVLSLASWVGIWLTTGATDTVTPSVLILLGIGAGTAVGAALIDTSRQARGGETSSAAGPPAAAAAPPNATDGARAPATGKGTSVGPDAPETGTGPARRMPAYERFLNDVLTDENGYAFHRVQSLAWTLVLGAYFVHEVWARLSMPDFGANLLTLLGISSGTYLGFKTVEPQPNLPRLSEVA